jgi:lipoprotein signal peptidase
VWPVFNVADSAVVVGALVLAWLGFRDREGRAREAADATGVG